MKVAPNFDAEAAHAEETEFGDLPQWNLDDLFPGMKSKEFEAAFDRAVPSAEAFEQKYKGKLGDLLESGDGLAAAIADYEGIEEELGPVGLYAGRSRINAA